MLGCQQDLVSSGTIARMANLATSSSTWNASGFGHVDPKVERTQLRKEIDGLMKRVDKAIANKELKAEDRIKKVWSSRVVVHRGVLVDRPWNDERRASDARRRARASRAPIARLSRRLATRPLRWRI